MSDTPSLPLPNEDPQDDQPDQKLDPAISLIRQKIDNLYVGEPPAKEEEKEIEASGSQSKHQQFIEQLMNSGKNIAQVQTAWHAYYQNLNADDRRQVWREFYDNQTKNSLILQQHAEKTKTVQQETSDKKPKKVIGSIEEKIDKTATAQTVGQIKKHLLDQVSAKGKLQPKHHLQSLLFGVGVGLIVIFIFMFGFFNERIIAPLISPSRTLTDTPIIVDPSANNVVGTDPVVIIPKINIEVPVVYGVNSIDEKVIHNALDSGVVHYPTSPVPGQNGNVAIVGHSSNNIFNKGKYKFAFVLLSRLQEGDTFMLNYNGKQYIYKVYAKKIVNPTDVAVLGPADRAATATLITCDPPGTALHRLVVIGEQISPSPANNAVAATPTTTQKPTTVPGESVSLFQRLFGWIWN